MQSPIFSHFDLPAMERHWFHSLLAPLIRAPLGLRIGRCEFVRYFSVFIWSMRVFGDFAVFMRCDPSFWIAVSLGSLLHIHHSTNGSFIDAFFVVMKIGKIKTSLESWSVHYGLGLTRPGCLIGDHHILCHEKFACNPKF